MYVIRFFVALWRAPGLVQSRLPPLLEPAH